MVRPFLIPLAALLAALSACSGTGLLNALTPSGGYRSAEGVIYDPALHLYLDIYAPVQAANAPVVVFFYGGRWEEGSPRDFRFVGQALASRGFLTMIPDYRHYPAVKIPVFVDDAARAVRWTQDQVQRYGGDSKKIFLMGHSSGAHLAAMLALDPEFFARAGVEPARIKGMVGLAGPYDFLPLTDADLRDMFGPPEKFELSQPISYVDGANPPLLLLHGEDDETVRVKNTRNLAAAVERAGGPVETFIYPKMSHPWILATVAAPLRSQSDVLDRVTQFIQREAAAPPRSAITPMPTGDKK